MGITNGVAYGLLFVMTFIGAKLVVIHVIWGFPSAIVIMVAAFYLVSKNVKRPLNKITKKSGVCRCGPGGTKTC